MCAGAFLRPGGAGILSFALCCAREGDIPPRETGVHIAGGRNIRDTPRRGDVLRGGYARPVGIHWAGFDCAPPFAALLEQDVLRLPGALQNFSRIAGCGDMPAKEWRICAQLYELFAELDAARGPAQGHGGNYVGQAVNYIESNYSQPMRVQDIAAGLGLNRSYFCRLFRQQTGLSPQEYIVSCRLAKAAQFMTEHGMSQEEAARQAGYPDVFSFSRMFRRKYGMPPGRYAARARQKQGG